QPDYNLSGDVVVPNDVGLAVAVDVARAGDQPAASRRHRARRATAREHSRAIHQPDHIIPGVSVAPKNVAPTVAIEVTGGDDGPAKRHRTNRAAADHGRAVDQPDHRFSGVAVAPENVALAIAIEIALADDAPDGRHRTKRAA